MLTNSASTSQVLKRLLSKHVKPYSAKIAMAVGFMIVVASCSALIVKLVEPSIDQVFLTHNTRMLVILPLMIIGVHSIKGIAEYYQSYLVKCIGQKILTDLQIRMYEHLLLADLAFIQSQSSGRLISRFTNDIALMRGAVSNLLVGCAKHLLSVVFLIAIMFKLQPTLSLVVFIAFPIAIYPVQMLGRRIRKVSAMAQEELGNFTATLDETFHSIKVVKSCQREDTETTKARQISRNIYNHYKRTAKFDALVSPIMEILNGIALAGIIWYGGTLVIKGEATPGTLFAFITAFVSAYRPFKSLISLNVNLQEGIAAARRVFSILDIEPQIKDNFNAKEISLHNPEIVLENVGLRFGEKVALKLMNLQLEKGKVTALVGRSGSGKTSISNLLVRFYDPSAGRVLINNHDVRELTITSLRNQIALVTQDTFLFDTTIAENIAYSNAAATRKQVIEAAKFADAHEFIMLLPQGYDTVIGNQGATLSGGQRQRISIARAFLKNSPILILDEATSSLDLNSEQAILNAITKLRAGKTTLIITHRLSSIKHVDKIVVMKHGEIVEQGSHKQLLQNKKEYSKLYNKELKEEL